MNDTVRLMRCEGCGNVREFYVWQTAEHSGCPGRKPRAANPRYLPVESTDVTPGMRRVERVGPAQRRTDLNGSR